ncbi:MAG: hypothetical protein AB8I08_18435 [Sandaracinaceae bacterium]
MDHTRRGNSIWNAGALIVALSLLSAATAEAQEPIALPLSIHIEHGERGPIAEDAYVDYAVELANRWLRPAGVCVFPASRHPLRRLEDHGDALARQRAGQSIPVAVVDILRRPDANDGIAGWGRGGRRPLVLLSTTAGRPFTLAHEMGHVLGASHIDDERDVMHRTTPANYEELVAPPMSRARARDLARAARRMQQRLGTHPSARCATPRALPHPSTLASGNPVLTRTVRRQRNGTYEGEQFFGTYHGQGTWRGDSGYEHRGEYRLGVRHGWGQVRYPGGNQYTGAFANGDRHGYGFFRYASGATYRGDYRRGDRHGNGVMVWSDGGTYVGEYRNDRHHGQGRKAWPSGSVYEGAWANGLEHGDGCRRYADGDVYEGPFERGRPHGHGQYRFASGTVYEGPMRRGRFHGQGRMRYRSGAHYRGAFERGQRHGFGQYRSADGTHYEGTYHRGERHGQGVLRRRNGRVEQRRYIRGRWTRS